MHKFPLRIRVYVGGHRIFEIKPRAFGIVGVTGPNDEQFSNERNVHILASSGHVFHFGMGLPEDSANLQCRRSRDFPSNVRVNELSVYFPFLAIKSQLELFGVDPRKRSSDDYTVYDDDNREM